MENSLLGLPPCDSLLRVLSAAQRGVLGSHPSSADVLLFGALLFEMGTGDRLTAGRPDFVGYECDAVVERIFAPCSESAKPVSIAMLLRLPLFASARPGGESLMCAELPTLDPSTKDLAVRASRFNEQSIVRWTAMSSSSLGGAPVR